MRYLTLTTICFFLCIVVIAQDSCSPYIGDVLATLDSTCEEINRNELCYGNNLVSVTTISGDELDFTQPGDVLSVLEITSIRTSPYAAPDEWGIALMLLQANVPDSLPGQNVTFLLFGEVDMTNAVVNEAMPVLTATTSENINVRSGPSTNFAVVANLQANADLELLGRNTAGDWAYVVSEGSSGWVFVSLLKTIGDVMSLDEVPDDFTGSSTFRPMQAVYFSSGIGKSTCEGVPQDGILIQTPDYKESIVLMVNDVEISLGSTIYVRAQANGVMSIYVLEGQIDVTVFDVKRIVPAGAFVNIPLDENLRASDVPNMPEAYSRQELETLPISILPEEISIARSAHALRIEVLNSCQGILADTVNVRGGPGVDYPIVATWDSQTSPIIAAQAVGTDGQIWYRVSLDSDKWLRSDLIALGDNCLNIAITEDIPEVRLPNIYGWGCVGYVTVSAGTDVYIADLVPDPKAPGSAIISTFRANDTVIFEEEGHAVQGGVAWGFSWTVNTPGQYEIEVIHKPTESIQPTWSPQPIGAGQDWSHSICTVVVK